MDTVGPQEIDVLCTTTMANQQPQLRSLLLQQLGNMAADKPGCTSDESFHERRLDWIITLSGSRDGREGSQHAALGVRTAGWEDNQNDSQAPAALCFRCRRRNCLLAGTRLPSAFQLPTAGSPSLRPAHASADAQCPGAAGRAASPSSAADPRSSVFACRCRKSR